MTDEFINQQLTTSVAQICSNIGWHSMSNSTLQMMTDILYGYFKDLAQSVKKFSEISDKLNPDIDDVKIAFQEKNVAIPDIINYLKQVGSIKSLYQVPKIPIPTKSNLNIMKPGNTEIIRRPISIHEHLPTMFPEQIEENVNQTPLSYSLDINNKTFSQTEISKDEKPPKENVIVHKKLREISSVVMTSSGFISSSRHGRLPESRLTLSNFQFAQKSHPTVLPEDKSGHHLKKNYNLEKEKKIIEATTNVKKDEKMCVKKTSKLKELKTGINSKYNQKIKKSSNITDISKNFLLNTIFDKPLEHSKLPKSSLIDSVKLTTEPDKQKLNIFKKISKVKDDSLLHQNSKLNNLSLSKPTSTIVSKDITINPDSKSDFIVDKTTKPVSIKQTIEKKPLKKIKIDPELTTSKKRKIKTDIQNNDNIESEPINTLNNLVIKKHKIKHEHDISESSVKFSFFGQDIQKTPHFLSSNPLIPKCTISNSGLIPIIDKNFFNELPSTVTTEDKKLSKKLKPKKLKKMKKDKIKTKSKKNKKNRNERKKDKMLKKKKIEEKLDSEKFDSEKLDSEKLDSEKLVLPKVLEEKKKECITKNDEAVPIMKVKLPDSNCSSLKHKIVIKPMVKNKSPPVFANDSMKEKLPDKPSNTKSRILKKEKEIVNLSESKIPKIKKIAVIDTQPVNIDKPSPDIISVPSTTLEKNKVKSSKKVKKNITQNLPAFYYDELGNQVWICPTCGKQDDGSPMIGCDNCDAWFHWVCMGIQCPPDCAVWYCPLCLKKRAQRSNNYNEKSIKRGRPMKKSVT